MSTGRLRLGLALLAIIVSPLSLAGASGLEPLPDAEITRAGTYSAWLVSPTTAYTHGVLGDAIEAEGLVVSTPDGQIAFHLDRPEVFEDRFVRLVEMNDDGIPEIMVVVSAPAVGARLALYRIADGQIRPLASSAAIEQPNRWLNPVGIANFAGQGEPLVAAVVTPHLAGSLRFYRVSGARLVEVGRFNGVTNHIIGTRDLQMHAIVDIDGDHTPEIILPSIDRTRLVAVSFQSGKPVSRKSWPVAGQIRAVDKAGETTVRLRLAGGDTVTVDLGQ